MRNPIDAIVEYVNPIAGVRRAQARVVTQILASGYSEGGASRKKTAFKGWNWKGGSPKEDIEEPLEILRQRSRDLYMNGPLGRAAINRIQTNVVGSGLALRATPDADALGLETEEASQWARAVEREWRLWADSSECDHIGLSTFDELQQVALISWLASGDVFALLPMDLDSGEPYDLRVHLIEADRICNPPNIPRGMTVRQGVEIDSQGRVRAYHIRSGHPLGPSYGQTSDAKWKRLPVWGEETRRRTVLHLMCAERPDQYRGVPILAPVIEQCKQLTRYAEAELMGAVVASLFTVFIKSSTPETPFAEAFSDEQPAEKSLSEDPEAGYQYALGSGAIVGLSPDEDIATASPTRPNVQFDAFVTSVTSEIGAAINVPSELLMLRFTSSYSASRAALLEAWKAFRMWRSWMSRDFCHPVYVEWLTEAVLRGRVQAPGFLQDPLLAWAWSRAQWHGPAPGQVDPLKEVQAAVVRVGQGFSSRSRETSELTGGDYETNVRQLAEEERRRREAGMSIPDDDSGATEPTAGQDGGA